MVVIYVPYHLDEYLAELNVPLPTDPPVIEVTAQLPDAADIWSRLARLQESVAGAVERSGGSPAVVVSGDCTTSIGITAGLQRAGIDPAIVWCDAHGDVQTLETTTSGYLGGMALRLLLGYRPELLADPLGLRPPPEDRVVLVDARDLDPPEVAYLDASSVTRLTVGELSAEALPPGPILLNLDLDIIDAAELPGLRYPAPDGPGVPAIVQAARTILGTGRVAAVNIACTWHPGHTDPEGTRERLISALLNAVAR